MPTLADECATIPPPELDFNRFSPSVQSACRSGARLTFPGTARQWTDTAGVWQAPSATNIRTIGWEAENPKSLRTRVDLDSQAIAFFRTVLEAALRSQQTSSESEYSRPLCSDVRFPRTHKKQDGRYASLFSKLHSFVGLKHGWDSYRAPAPQSSAISHAECFLNQLGGADIWPSRLSPSVVGGIGVTFREGRRKGYVEFYNNGTVYALFSDGESEPTTRPVEPTQDGYASLLAEIREYLNA